MTIKPTDRLKALARENRISEGSISEKQIAAIPDAHAPHGERSDFLKLTVTLSPEVYGLIADEVKRRKLAREPNAGLSAVLREAVTAFFGKR
jgi:transcriptional regulator of met regulon